MTAADSYTADLHHLGATVAEVEQLLSELGFQRESRSLLWRLQSWQNVALA